MHEPEMPGPKDTEPWHIVKPSMVHALNREISGGQCLPYKAFGSSN